MQRVTLSVQHPARPGWTIIFRRASPVPVVHLYRAISRAERDQIVRDRRFKYGGGAEGKYFWERLHNANGYLNEPNLVRATYTRAAVKLFYRLRRQDGLGLALFA